MSNEVTLSEDILSKFLEETKATDNMKKKQEEIELPSNYVVLNQKQILKMKRDSALERLNKLKGRSGNKMVGFGVVVSQRAKANMPSPAFMFDKDGSGKEGKKEE